MRSSSAGPMLAPGRTLAAPLTVRPDEAPPHPPSAMSNASAAAAAAVSFLLDIAPSIRRSIISHRRCRAGIYPPMADLCPAAFCAGYAGLIARHSIGPAGLLGAGLLIGSAGGSPVTIELGTSVPRLFAHRVRRAD